MKISMYSVIHNALICTAYTSQGAVGEIPKIQGQCISLLWYGNLGMRLDHIASSKHSTNNSTIHIIVLFLREL